MKRKLLTIFAFVMMSLLSTTIYANDMDREGYNVVVDFYETEDGEFEYLTSEDGYVKIFRSSANLKVINTTFDPRQLLLGNVGVGTEVVIEVYNDKDENYSLQPIHTYVILVEGANEFEQLIELPEGANKIKVNYLNWEDKKSGYMEFYIDRESVESKVAIENFVVKMNMK